MKKHSDLVAPTWARCDHCGGEIPPDPSDMWDAADDAKNGGECPGYMADGGMCGAWEGVDADAYDATGAARGEE